MSHDREYDAQILTFNRYQTLTGRTAVYPGAGTGSAEALAYAGLGLGEAGEVQGKIKKVLRDNDGALTPESRKAIADELGDVLWYIARIAIEIDTSLERIAQANLGKLSDREMRGVLGGSGDNR